MSRRTLLKIIAFICGLYFFLEFMLPAKIGGDFDCDSVHSPVKVQTADGPIILYVGQYNRKEASLGRLVPAQTDAAGWRREPDEPVLQRSLFVPYEKNGMQQLDVVAGPSGLDLFYLGINSKQEFALCHAAGDLSGKQWKRTGAVLFATNGIPRPTVSEPNGQLPGSVMFFAAGRDAGRWVLLLALKAAGGLEIWPASGDSLKAMKLGPAALIPSGKVPGNLTMLDGKFGDGCWTVNLVTEGGVTRFSQQADGTFLEASPRDFKVEGCVLTGMRTDKTGDASVIGYKRSWTNATGQQLSSTEIMTGSISADPSSGFPWQQRVKSVGKAGQSTYLSQGTPTIANYVQIIGSFAIFLALINLTMFHGKRIVRLQKGSVHSVIFFIFTIAMAVVAYIGEPSAAAATDWRRGFNFILAGVITPMGTAVFSMITFFMISAAYRSFRVRSFEAALLMIAACIVMLGQMPIGQWMTSFLPDAIGIRVGSVTLPVSLEWLHLPWLAEKLLWLANACAYRGVLIGIAVGGFAIGLRIWLGMDNTVYSGMEEKK